MSSDLANRLRAELAPPGTVSFYSEYPAPTLFMYRHILNTTTDPDRLREIGRLLCNSIEQFKRDGCQSCAATHRQGLPRSWQDLVKRGMGV